MLTSAQHERVPSPSEFRDRLVLCAMGHLRAACFGLAVLLARGALATLNINCFRESNGAVVQNNGAVPCGVVTADSVCQVRYVNEVCFDGIIA